MPSASATRDKCTSDGRDGLHAIAFNDNPCQDKPDRGTTDVNKLFPFYSPTDATPAQTCRAYLLHLYSSRRHHPFNWAIVRGGPARKKHTLLCYSYIHTVA